jgi:hypothetical protein
MTREEILAELEKMTNEERLEVIEAATRLLPNEMKRSPAGESRAKMDQQLLGAAQMMRGEYAAGGELTATTALDNEDLKDGPTEGDA